MSKGGEQRAVMLVRRGLAAVRVRSCELVHLPPKASKSMQWRELLFSRGRSHCAALQCRAWCKQRWRAPGSARHASVAWVGGSAALHCGSVKCKLQLFGCHRLRDRISSTLIAWEVQLGNQVWL